MRVCKHCCEVLDLRIFLRTINFYKSNEIVLFFRFYMASSKHEQAREKS